MRDGGRRYITTPIYYASGEPHIGHAYTTILADALARFDRQDGAEVLFLTGTDEHGPKIQETAEQRGLEPIELCDMMAERFRAAWGELSVDFNRFIRTTEPEHAAVVRALLERLDERGHVYEGAYEGWYCIHEERYWTEKDLGPDRSCPDCGRPTQRLEETNYFFRMSDFQDDLVRHIEENPEWILPEVRRNEVLGFLQRPLGDLSISRPRSRVPWGIPLPFDDDHVAYVWVDALTNYVTASGAIDPAEEPGRRGFDEPREGSWWPADLHILGKDILTTHAVYWPTLLMAAGLPLPRQLLAHGWWVVGETKMSKSLGNVIDPLGLSEEYGPDAVRWYLLREMPTGQDASYTPERFLTRYEELANVFGNLASRALGMIDRYRDGTVPEGDDGLLNEAVDVAYGAARSAIEGYRIDQALAAAMDLARAANGFVENREPWTLAKDPERAGELDATLGTLARVLCVLTALFHPATPGRAGELADRLGLEETPTLREARTVPLAGHPVRKGDPLFPRV